MKLHGNARTCSNSRRLLVVVFEDVHKPAKTGRSGRFAKHKVQLETLVGLLMEPAGRQTRRRAAEAICDARR